MINENDLLVKIVVFDSGLGSLSIIKEIQKIVKTDIVYLLIKKLSIWNKITGSISHNN